MTPFLHGVARAMAGAFDLPGPILEVGSFQVPGEEEVNNLRSLFPNREYVGMDIRAGNGVDLVGSVEELPQAAESVGTVIAMSVFEHVRRFWRGFDEVGRVLRPGGAFIVSVPFHCRVHNHPSDYWRFTTDALEVLLEDFPQRVIGWHGPEDRPENVWALAFRPGAPAITTPQFEHYTDLLRQHAHQPMRWRRRLRYQFFDWIDGRGLCRPLLEQEKWETYCSTLAGAKAAA